jgi:hypothetical protein
MKKLLDCLCYLGSKEEANDRGKAIRHKLRHWLTGDRQVTNGSGQHECDRALCDGAGSNQVPESVHLPHPLSLPRFVLGENYVVNLAVVVLTRPPV